MYSIELNLGIHNAGKRIYEGHGNNDFGLIVPSGLKIRDIGDDSDEEESFSIHLPDGRELHTFGPLGKILPDGWEAPKPLLIIMKYDFVKDEGFLAIARIFTEIGPKDISFKIIPEEEEIPF